MTALEGPLARRLVLRALRQVEAGCLVVSDPLGRERFGAVAPDFPVPVEVEIDDAAVYRSLALRGALGASERFMDGAWRCDDLTALFRILERNRRVLLDLDRGLPSLLRVLPNALHSLRRNTRRGARRNIHEHYDLGNDFFSSFLDPSMTYSCGVFPSGDATLEAASIEKYDRLCRMLRLEASDRVLEIGTGWGGFAEYAAAKYGCRVTTTSISERQVAYARERIERADLSDRVTVLCEDYRDLSGCYDKLVSIEMIEAVGHQYFPEYFRQCSRRLSEGGLFALQAIVIRDQFYERAIRNVDFIRRYVFPGGDLPSLAEIARCVAAETDFQIAQVHDITDHYPETLRRWRRDFHASKHEIRSWGYEERLLRMWDFYLCYAEAGFRERHIGCQQFLLAKPRAL